MAVRISINDSECFKSLRDVTFRCGLNRYRFVETPVHIFGQHHEDWCRSERLRQRNSHGGRLVLKLSLKPFSQEQHLSQKEWPEPRSHKK